MLILILIPAAACHYCDALVWGVREATKGDVHYQPYGQELWTEQLWMWRMYHSLSPYQAVVMVTPSNVLPKVFVLMKQQCGV